MAFLNTEARSSDITAQRIFHVPQIGPQIHGSILIFPIKVILQELNEAMPIHAPFSAALMLPSGYLT